MAASSRRSDQQQRRPDGQTWNVGVVARTTGGNNFWLILHLAMCDYSSVISGNNVNLISPYIKKCSAWPIIFRMRIQTNRKCHQLRYYINYLGCRRLVDYFPPCLQSFSTRERHRLSTSTNLYCFVTEAHRCEQLAQGCHAALSR